MRIFACHGKRLLKKELKRSFLFFLREANWNKQSIGFGLIRDKTIFADEISSIASCGYGLAALAIGVSRKWIRFEEAYDKANGMLDTFLYHVEGKNGFYYHFVNLYTGKREWNCEISIIDTGIFICGALLAGEFFEGEVKSKAEQLYKRINWQWYQNKQTNQFYMGYRPETGFFGAWDMYAEQLMLYILGVCSPSYPVEKSMYDAIKKPEATYANMPSIIYSYFGSLFTYQFSHAWIDFRNKQDENSIDWFQNSVKATKANQIYCIQNKTKFKTYGENSWGLTACIGPKGYSGGYGACPAYSNLEEMNDGTVPPCGAAGSIVFTPKESIKALENYYHNLPKTFSKYGFIDAFNLEGEKAWYSKEYIGIDKGISLLMIENYLSGFIWKFFMKNHYVQEGLEILGIREIKEKKVVC